MFFSLTGKMSLPYFRTTAAATLDELDEKLTEMSTQRDETYDVHGVPPHFKEHYIISGYRSPKASFAQSLLYCFGLNNEVKYKFDIPF